MLLWLAVGTTAACLTASAAAAVCRILSGGSYALNAPRRRKGRRQARPQAA